MEPAGLEFITVEAEAVCEDISHDRDFLCGGVVFHGFEYQIIIEVIAHAETARQNWIYALILPAWSVLLKSRNSTVPFEKNA